MEIDIDNYVSEEEKAEIARSVFRDKCAKIAEDKERIITNQAYDVVVNMINDQINEDVETLIRDKAIQLIDELSVYCAFKSPDYWNKSSKGYDVLQTALKENQQRATDKIASLIDGLDESATSEMLKDCACELLDWKLFGGEQK